MEKKIENKGERWFSVQIKPVGSFCNLRCKYCYAKSYLAPEKIMSQEVLEAIIRKLVNQDYIYPTFSWHGGEPTLVGYEFFRKALDLIEYYKRPNQQFYNLIQTNATLITPELADLFREYNFGVSVSLDGPSLAHGKNRIFPTGKNSFKAVIKGINTLREHNIDPLVICTVSRETLPLAEENIKFFIELGFKKIKYNPVFDGIGDRFSLTNREWFIYLKKVFDVWFDIGDPDIQIRDLDEVISWIDEKPLNICSSNKTCINWISIDPDGDLYPCEYLREGYKYGNILEMELEDIFESPDYIRFVNIFNKVPEECKSCEFYNLCGNGCPMTRVKAGGEIALDGVYVFCEQRKRLYFEIKKIFDKVLSR